MREKSDVLQLANKVSEALGTPYQIGGHQLITGTSIGISLAPDDGSDPDQLLKNADIAMYEAKSAGRGTCRFFEQSMIERLKLRQELELELRQAMRRGDLQVHYQPVIDVRTKAVTGCEALLRWPHANRGMIPPAEFIPLAEETGLIVALGEWVLRTACTDAASWPEEIKVAINVSPVQFRSGNLVQVVINALASSRLPVHRLELEITEAVLISDDERARDILRQLRELGVKIAMDDFGTGYSSLSYLQRFPLDKIKIDRSFIKGLAEEGGSSSIVQALITIANSHKITTTAEGVETEQQLESLRILGCNEMQGFLFSPAKPASEVLELLRSLGNREVAVA